MTRASLSILQVERKLFVFDSFSITPTDLVYCFKWYFRTHRLSVDISDIVTKVVPSYLIYNAPSNEPGYSRQPSVPTKFASLCMQFILALALTKILTIALESYRLVYT